MSQSNHKLETESQFILRLPQTQANALRQAIKSGEPLSKRLFIKFDSDIRHGCVKFDNWVVLSRLYDLPTIIESYKTLDRKNFYKTADISQILICKEDQEVDDSNQDITDDEAARRAKYDKIFASVGGSGRKEFQYPHGITPPLKNVRKRRFRKTLKKKYVDFSEIEKEVKLLLKSDCEAIDSRYELVEEPKDKVQANQFNPENVPSPMSGGAMATHSAENSQNIDLHELFGGDCSSSDDSYDEDEEDDDKDDDIDNDQDNEIDNDDDETMNEDDAEDVSMVASSGALNNSEQAVPPADIAAEVAAASDLIAQSDDREERKQELHRELARIRERIQNQENEMRGLDNQALRQRLQPVLDSLHEQENEIKKQLDLLNDNM